MAWGVPFKGRAPAVGSEHAQYAQAACAGRRPDAADPTRPDESSSASQRALCIQAEVAYDFVPPDRRAGAGGSARCATRN